MSDSGKTYGYGRVSSRIAPSPYSPLHVPSRMPGAMPVPAEAPPPRRSRVVRIVLLALVAVLAGIAAGAFHFGTPAQRPAATRPAAVANPSAPGDEAERLPRSAIATSRPARPRS